MDKKNKKKKGECIPSDRLIIYVPIPIIDQLKKLGQEKGLTKNKMALSIITDNVKIEN